MPNAAYYAANKERLAADLAAWRAAHPERVAQHNQTQYEKDPQAAAARTKRYRGEHPDRALPGKLRSNRARRLRLAIVSTPYRREAIFERDHYTCQLCGEGVDMTLPFTDPMGKTLDHIVPLIDGGADQPDNVQLAHRRCNSLKGCSSWDS